MPNQSLQMRYPAEMALLDAALTSGRGVTYAAESRAKAITMISRCNKVRALMRRADPDGLCPYDAFTISAQDALIIVRLRPTLDPQRLAPLPGSLGLERE